MSDEIVNEIKSKMEILDSKFDGLSSKQEAMSKTISNWFKSFVLAFVGVFGGLVTFAVGYGSVQTKVEINSNDIVQLKEKKQDKETIEYKFSIILEKIDNLKKNETE